MKINPIPLFFFVVCLGCGDAPNRAGSSPVSEAALSQSRAERDTVLARLSTLKQDAFRSAFARLAGHDYTRYARTEQFDQEGFLVAYVEREVRHERGGGARIERQDSLGTFDFGLFKRVVSARANSLGPVDLIPLLLPEDPAYLLPRNWEQYRYRQRPDTLLWDRTARVIDIRALPVLADGQNIRYVRYYIDRETNELMAIYLERTALSLLFREESRFYLHLQRLPGGDWLPYNTRLHTRIKTLFATPRQFRTVATYYEVGP